jgi:C4-dicarboxylate transporter DctM subunit
MLATLLIAFPVLLVAGCPVGFAMALAAVLALLAGGTIPLTIVPQTMAGALDSFPILAVPFFLLAGELMESGGLTTRLLRFSGCLVGHLKGGLMQMSILGSLIFSGVSGSAVADASAIGSITIKAMIRKGYDAAYVAAVQAGAAAVGPIFPPSITMIVWASMTSLSVGAMFLGGVVPGLLMYGSLMVYNHYHAARAGYEGEKRASARELQESFVAALPALVMPVLILGGIVSGVFTATEAGCIACVYAFIAGRWIYRELRLKDLEAIFVRATAAVAMVMLIVSASTTFGWVLAIEDFPNLVVGALLNLTGSSSLGAIAILMLFLLIIGCFIDVLPAAIILIPVLNPIAGKFGLDPIYYAVLMVMTLTVGLITPPVGVALYICSGIAGVPLSASSRKVLVPVVLMLLICVLCAVLPELITAVPRWLMPRAFAR